MTSTTKSTPRAIVVLKLPGSVPALITMAKAIIQAMTANAAFATPQPALADVATATTNLQTSEAAALARTKGAVATRDQQKVTLVALLRELGTYVQHQADANAESATAIIQGAGMNVRKTAVRKPRVFAAAPGAVSGTVKLETSSAGHRASYEWQYSLDGGKTWLVAPSTLQAKTIILGLTPGVSVMFKYRAVTKTGEGDWSQPVTIIVK